MNSHNKEIQDRLDKMPFDEARKAVRLGTLYTIGSLNHEVALSWLEGKEAELRDERETVTLAMAREANLLAHEANSRTSRITRFTLGLLIIAIVALLIALIAARKDIVFLVSWIMNG
jgi:hypothetical protein